jgi:hypothetical protein
MLLKTGYKVVLVTVIPLFFIFFCAGGNFVIVFYKHDTKAGKRPGYCAALLEEAPSNASSLAVA